LWACSAPEEEKVAGDTSSALEHGTRVCSWNIRRLGHAFDHLPKNIEVTASIIEDNCDVIAVQEVMQTTGGATPGYADLEGALGSAWDGMITDHPRPNTNSSSAEHYAFFFRKSAAAQCSGWRGARDVSDEPDTFLREPAWTCLKLNGRSRDLLLVTYHALFGSLAERRREVGALDDDLDRDGLADDVVRSVQASRRNADVLIVGDFNLTPRELAEELPRYKDLTKGSGSTVNATDEVTANLYDHLLVPPNQPALAGLKPAEVIDVRRSSGSDSFYKNVSDHLPIRFVVETSE
jgi:endonuclease/exonuclease/phosphatase family metal-dependent hydrolase